MSVGVRELVVESPPPEEAPTGSTDWSSMDLPSVYDKPVNNPFSNLFRKVICTLW